MRGLLLYGLYLGVVLVAATIFCRAVGSAVFAAEAPAPVAESRANLPCDELASMLTKELWAWYFQDVQALGPDTLRRGPLPGALKEWETLRQAGAARCHTNKTREQFSHLLSLRRALENQSYLLSTTAGADIAALR